MYKAYTINIISVLGGISLKNRKYFIMLAFFILFAIVIYNYFINNKINSIGKGNKPDDEVLIEKTDSKEKILNSSEDGKKEYSPKIVYLTFDDGPSYKVTNKILDVLKEKGVKATFFVVGYKIEGREETLKRIQNEGHSIGLHSYTHNYKKLYRNEDSFIKEMIDTENEVYRVTGTRPKIIRFPSGSKKHLTESLQNKLHEKGYKVYDWNACVSDGIDYHVSSQRLFKEVVKSSEKWSKVILLMHCDEMNGNTCEVLPATVDYFKEKGYEFKAINENTPEYHFRIKK